MNSKDFEYIHAAEYARLVRRFSRNKSHIQARWDARKMKRVLENEVQSTRVSCKRM